MSTIYITRGVYKVSFPIFFLTNEKRKSKYAFSFTIFELFFYNIIITFSMKYRNNSQPFQYQPHRNQYTNF